MDRFPVLGAFLLLVVIVLAAAEIGFRFGVWLRERSTAPRETRMTGAVVGSMLGLMGFLIAFSIGIAIGQHGDRKSMVVTEANAIGTAWLRAGFLGEPDSTSVRNLLREYVEIRLEAAADVKKLPAVVARSEEIHGELWSIIEGSVRQGNNSDIMAIVVESINDVIDVHSLRLAAATMRLPRVLGQILIAATILSFLLVGVASSVDRKRDTVAVVIFALAFVAVLMIMVDLDRPQEGLLTVNQTAMSDVLRQMTPLSQ
ncbi:MAG: hypothetical protein P8127_09080 [Acidobacteriota bacterium]